MRIYFGPYIQLAKSILQNEIYTCPKISCEEQKTELVPGDCRSCGSELICLEIERECLDSFLKKNNVSDLIEKVSENTWIFPKEFESKDDNSNVRSAHLQNAIDPWASLIIAKKKYDKVLRVFDEVFGINTHNSMKLGFVAVQTVVDPVVKESIKTKCAICKSPTSNYIPSPFVPCSYYRCEKCFNAHRVALPEMIMVLKNGIQHARKYYGKEYFDKYLFSTEKFYKMCANDMWNLSQNLKDEDYERLFNRCSE